MATRRVLAALALLVTLAHGLEDPCAPDCSTGVELIPHPRSCAYFYQCSNGIAYLQSCPFGLHFAPSVLYCDYPSQAHCTARPDAKCGDAASTGTLNPATDPPVNTTIFPVNITTSSANTTPFAGTATPFANNTTSFANVTVPPANNTTLSEKVTASPENMTFPPANFRASRNFNPVSRETTSATDCVPPCPSPSALYPHPHDCSSYFHCAYSVPYLKRCPPGQEYSGPLVRCDYPSIAKCSASPSNPCVAVTNPPTPSPAPQCAPACPWPDAYMPHPQDCTKFYICGGMVAFESKCQTGLHYDMNLVRCDYPELANCVAHPDRACDELLRP